MTVPGILLPDRAFVLIRHGETDANRAGLIVGRLEAQLTDRGRAEAAALAGIDWPETPLLFVSPQARARETAALAFPGLPRSVVDGLRERDWGRLEGRPLAEMIPREATPEAGEAWADMLARVAAALRFALQDPRGGLPVLVAHSGTIRAVRRLTGGSEHGPRAANAAPILFTPGPGLWAERLWPRPGTED
ncbi:histidine phosphatase family protein [Pseudodonghicola flavimaris]|uniref:Histidine phosphatase family protein n=1 Tax=Pseudodonghicola flavimaris TaxID=3050036 RepID=A0ABT7EW73_9RHOB|nr:histidine phosphatase family protein [Pseudodonghicola flavimaris]MDK3016599.1 histidine phosphatase family protein [Pseudodonghicola flavimaris]